jgi:AraC family transcriptional regulator
LFNPCGTTHEDRFLSQAGRFLALSIAPERLAQVQDGLASVDHSVALPCDVGTSIARKMQRELRVQDATASLVLEGLALELLGFASRLIPGKVGRRPPSWLLRARELIDDRYAESITAREIAAQVGVHPYHLARMFRRFLQLSPGEYLRECRVRRATDLLAGTRLSLSEIALRCGYADQSQFTRSYRQHTGTTPGAVRRS